MKPPSNTQNSFNFNALQQECAEKGKGNEVNEQNKNSDVSVYETEKC